jgi:hypothetical protein
MMTPTILKKKFNFNLKIDNAHEFSYKMWNVQRTLFMFFPPSQKIESINKQHNLLEKVTIQLYNFK